MFKRSSEAQVYRQELPFDNPPPILLCQIPKEVLCDRLS